MIKIKAKKVTRYYTSDSQEWPTSAEAVGHQRSIDFRVWYDEHSLIGYADAGEMMAWLEEHKEVILAYYSPSVQQV